MKKPIIYGIISGIILLAVYFAILSLANSVDHAISQFFSMWYFILALAIGFGIQVSLFTYVRSYKNALAATSVSVSGGVSTTSMAACCAHHISDILPIVGLFSNLIGINFMLHTMKKHNMFDKNNKLFSKIMKQDLKFTLKLNIILSFIITLISINYAGGIL